MGNNCFHHHRVNSSGCLTFRMCTVTMWNMLIITIANIGWKIMRLPVKKRWYWSKTIITHRWCWRRHRSLEIIQLMPVDHLRLTRFITVQKLNVINIWFLVMTNNNIYFRLVLILDLVVTLRMVTQQHMIPNRDGNILATGSIFIPLHWFMDDRYHVP